MAKQNFVEINTNNNEVIDRLQTEINRLKDKLKLPLSPEELNKIEAEIKEKEKSIKELENKVNIRENDSDEAGGYGSDLRHAILNENEEEKESPNLQIQETKLFTGKTNGFTEPFDRRLPNVYGSSERLNGLPNSPDFYGSNSIFCPYALLHINKVGSIKIHESYLDQEGKESIRSAKFSPRPYNIEDFNATVTKEDTVDKDGNIIETKFKVNDAQNLNMEGYDSSKGSEVYADASGDMYYYVENKNMILWTAKNFTLKGIFNKIQLEATITEFGNEEVLKNNGHPSNPNSEDFWFLRYGYSKTVKKGNDSTDDEIIEENDLKVNAWYSNEVLGMLKTAAKEGGENKISDEERRRIKKENEKVKRDVGTYKNMNWIGEFVKEKVYITNPKETNEPILQTLEPTYENLCSTDVWKGDDQFIYEYQDFIWGKYYNLVPNNRLITLRRFPVPVLDHGRVPDQESSGDFVLPIARAVTWADGEDNKLEDLMKAGWQIKWTDATASINDVRQADQNAGDPDISLGGGGSSSSMWGKMLGWAEKGQALYQTGGLGTDAYNAEAERQMRLDELDPYENGPKSNMINGPVNVIDKTKKRERGLESDDSGFSIKFGYLLNSIGGINPKVAMLDLIANFLALTYNSAMFWGGATRFFPDRKIYPFLGAKKGKDAFMRGDLAGWISSIADQATSALNDLGSVINDLLSNPLQALSKLANKSFKVYSARKTAGKRPNVMMFKALLDGSPVGEWHLMVGDPFNPLMMVGNLICEGCDMEFPGNTIGYDNMPTEICFTVKLKHGMSRDAGSIGSMLNNGNGALYYARKGKRLEFDHASSTRSSEISKDGRSAMVTGAKGIGNKGTSELINGTPYTKPKRDVKRGVESPRKYRYNKSKKHFDVNTWQGMKDLFRYNGSKFTKTSAWKLAEGVALKNYKDK